LKLSTADQDAGLVGQPTCPADNQRISSPHSSATSPNTHQPVNQTHENSKYFGCSTEILIRL
jgi:hypothetical protein